MNSLILFLVYGAVGIISARLMIPNQSRHLNSTSTLNSRSTKSVRIDGNWIISGARNWQQVHNQIHLLEEKAATPPSDHAYFDWEYLEYVGAASKNLPVVQSQIAQYRARKHDLKRHAPIFGDLDSAIAVLSSILENESYSEGTLKLMIKIAVKENAGRVMQLLRKRAETSTCWPYQFALACWLADNPQNAAETILEQLNAKNGPSSKNLSQAVRILGPKECRRVSEKIEQCEDHFLRSVLRVALVGSLAESTDRSDFKWIVEKYLAKDSPQRISGLGLTHLTNSLFDKISKTDLNYAKELVWELNDDGLMQQLPKSLRN